MVAPDFELTLLDGSTVKASRLWQERPVVLTFVTSWCTACECRKREMARLAKESAAARGFVGIAAADDADALGKYVDDHDISEVGLDNSQAIWQMRGPRTTSGRPRREGRQAGQGLARATSHRGSTNRSSAGW